MIIEIKAKFGLENHDYPTEEDKQKIDEHLEALELASEGKPLSIDQKVMVLNAALLFRAIRNKIEPLIE